MARTSAQIFDNMVAAKNAEPSLAGLTSNSATAFWRLIFWVCANAIAVLELAWDAFKITVQSLLDAQAVGNVDWYRKQILAFQYGDSLVFLNDKYQYAALDATKKIIARCAIIEANDPSVGAVLRVKVAKSNGSNLTALSNTELTALESYMSKIRFAGTRYQLFSNNGDILKIGLKIYFDPIIPQATIQVNIEATIQNYIKNLPFNGELMIIKLIDALQLIDGVKDIEFLNAASKFSTGDAYQTFTRVKIADGGYFQISTASSETLADTVLYESII